MKKLIILIILYSLVLTPAYAATNTKSLDFELSSSQQAKISDASQTGLDLTGDLTIETWIRFESVGSDVHIAGKYNTTGSNRSYNLRFDGGADTIRFGNSSDGQGSTEIILSSGTGSFTTNVWYHIAVTYDASAGTAKFYKNGSQLGSDATGGNTSIYNGTADFTISGRNASPIRFLDGEVDEMIVWSDIRTSGEISTSYNAGSGTCYVGNEAGMVAYWRFEDNANDTHANGNNLTLVNSPTYNSDVPITCPETEASPVQSIFSF